MSVFPLVLYSSEQFIPLVQVNIGLLAHQIGVTAANTLYLGESIDDLVPLDIAAACFEKGSILTF
jgi:hypothetical protein